MLHLEHLTRRFGDLLAVDAVSLEVAVGELVTLLGPSGCGKTTTLRLIAGFETPTTGRIFLDGRDVTALPAQRRGVGMVFQNYALFPHLDVFENVAFGLKARRLSRKEITARVGQALERVDLAGYGPRRVQELSGGQQQRVALARALAPEPPVLLLDEPLSNLDAALRERTRVELRRLLKRLGITAIFVTHDQEEAFALSDRIALLEAGRLQQVGTPEDLYQDPANPFVASFLGRANFLTGRIVQETVGSPDATLVCELDGGARWRVRTPAPNGAGTAPSRTSPAPDRPVRVMVRPEALRILRRAPGHAATTGAAETPGTADLEGTVLERRFAGAVTYYRIRTGETELFAHGTSSDAQPRDAVLVRPAETTLPLAFDAPEQRAEPVVA